MSRGLGKVERAVLEVLEERYKKLHDSVMTRISIPDLVDRIYGQSPMAAALRQALSEEKGYQTIKRATKSLERKGLIVRESDAKHCWVEFKRIPRRVTLKDWEKRERYPRGA